MSVFGVDYGTISGGGSVASGSGTTTTQNEVVKVETGLSTITHFTLVWINTSGNTTGVGVLEYNSNKPTEYMSVFQNDSGSAVNGGRKNIGTRADNIAFFLDSISANGDVNLNAPNQANFYTTSYWWYAE